MAEIVLGFTCSHGPMIGTPPEAWLLSPPASPDAKYYVFRDRVYSYNEMKALRADENLAKSCAPDVRAERHARIQKQMDDLADLVAAANPDVIVITGDDQREWFGPDKQPAFSVAAFPEIVNVALDGERVKKLRPWRHLDAEYLYKDKVDRRYRVETALAGHVVDRARQDGFDLSVCTQQPESREGAILGHAFSFVCRRILKDRAVPIVPFPINTMYPPNQPTPRRSYDFGRMLARAIKDWDSDKRVAVCGSGGLSHFACDEAWDRRIMDEVRAGDGEALARENDANFGSGNSEVKNWIICAGAMHEAKLKAGHGSYTPCYTDPAGIGQGMGVMAWD